MSNKKEMKRAGIIWRILKWIGLTVLSVLIILGLIFEAPWKVITLLLIVLAACRILPKPAIKWFWLSVGFVVIVAIIWVFLPDRNGGWRPYTFDEELAALEARYAIPDSENAATIYNQLLEKYDSNSFYSGLEESEAEKIPMREPWLSEEHPQIAEWLEKHQTTISMLLNASRIEKCRFAINADIVRMTDTMDRLSPMRKWAYLLISAANNDIAEGRSEEGLEKLVAVLQMGNHHRQQASLIECLVGVALEALSIGQFKRFTITGDATDEHLIVIQKALEAIKYDWRSDFPRFIEHEKLFAKNFWGLFYGVNSQGKIRLGRGLTEIVTGELLELEDVEDMRFVTYLFKRLMKLQRLLFWFCMPSSPQRAGAIVDEVYQRFDTMAEPDYNWKEQKKPGKMLRLNYQYLVKYTTEALAPVYHGVHDSYLRSITAKRGNLVIVALRRYKDKNGSWPGSLDEVHPLASEEIFIDPVNNGSFVYKLIDDGFTLYSKGKNGVDDGGKRDDKRGADDWLIWPTTSQKMSKNHK